ncbi:hypothetical protein SC407_00255 [Legionella pneumophila serogroup 1]|uniref:hypothetical protein n=1 Tax=Legionella pneumophila TaxID=446 RepID=UPI0007707D68|nr:hypothetical protein [Legionella pneumophila]CZG00314.1 Uncharacterised protein [Legionella pneumophila]STX83655.1 Uncharacterised protein [Legionella pneumophila]
MSANEKALMQELKEAIKIKTLAQSHLTKEEQHLIVVYLVEIKEFYKLNSIFDFFWGRKWWCATWAIILS